MSAGCTHLDQVKITQLPGSVDGCVDCLRDGGVWLHNDTVLRLQVDDNPEPIKEYINSNITLMKWMIAEGYQDPRSLQRRCQARSTICTTLRPAGRS